MKGTIRALAALLLALSLLLSGCATPAAPQTQPTQGTEAAQPTQGTEPTQATEATEQTQESTQPQKDHTDTDNDGVCDECGDSVLEIFDIFAVNDLHGKLCDTTEQPGVDELSTYLKNAVAENENTIVLSSGDMWQGSAESNLTDGLMMTEWMNELDFVSMTMGNHEYDWGEGLVLDNLEIAEFPFLGINIYDRDTDARVDYCDASLMVEKSGVQIGIIGAMGDCYSSIASDHTKGIYFQVGDELTELVKEEAQRLRAAGADFIVYTIHDGYSGTNYSETATDNMLAPYYDTILSDGYVDIVFEAHTHKHYIKQDGHGVWHLQGGGDNRGITHAQVEINAANGSSRVILAEFVGTEVYEDLPDDPVVEQLLEKYDDQVSIGEEVLGYNAKGRTEDSLRKTAAMLYYAYGQELWGDQYDIVLGGGFFTVRSPGYLAKGDVTYAQLQMLFPFDNYLVLCSVKGSDLLEKFFETDNDRYFIYYEEYGEQVYEDLDPNKTYYIVVDTYTSTYKYNRLTEIQRWEKDFFTRDMLAEYIQEGNMR